MVNNKLYIYNIINLQYNYFLNFILVLLAFKKQAIIIEIKNNIKEYNKTNIVPY